jgi:hypothetical protein
LYPKVPERKDIMGAGKTVGLLLAIILLVIVGMPIHMAFAQVESTLPETSSITAHKFNDSNSNAIQDAGEEDIEGWLIRLYEWDGTDLERISEERTNSAGLVSFSNLVPATYKVWEEQIGCWQPTTPEGMNSLSGGYYARIALEEGQNVVVEFGNVLADDEAPIIDMPEDVFVACGGTTRPDSTGYALANDNCDPSPVVTYADSRDGNVITRTWTASDASGNSVGYDQFITVEDTSEPIIVCPGAITIEDGDPTYPSNTGGWASATDDCSDNVDITYSDSRNQNTITRTWTATDSAGNTASCVQVITIMEPAPTYSLTIASGEGGSVTTPGEGTFGPYYHGETVNLVATPDTDYSFVNWTGTGASTIDDPNSASTFITMIGDCDIQANFVLNRWLQVDGMLNSCCSITIDTDDNTPNELSSGDSGVFAFPEGTTVTLSATTCIECCGEESQFLY